MSERSRNSRVGTMMTSTGWERELLLGRLAAQRQHILTAVAGLSEEQLRCPVLPSGWSCLGLVRHLTVSDERYWFDTVMGGAALDYWPVGAGPDDTAADWRVHADEPAAQIIEEYGRAIDRSDAIIGGLDLDAPPRITEAWWAEAGMRFSRCAVRDRARDGRDSHACGSPRRGPGALGRAAAPRVVTRRGRGGNRPGSPHVPGCFAARCPVGRWLFGPRSPRLVTVRGDYPAA